MAQHTKNTRGVHCRLLRLNIGWEGNVIPENYFGSKQDGMKEKEVREKETTDRFIMNHVTEQCESTAFSSFTSYLL